MRGVCAQFSSIRVVAGGSGKALFIVQLHKTDLSEK
jgi:hypothetical protein